MSNKKNLSKFKPCGWKRSAAIFALCTAAVGGGHGVFSQTLVDDSALALRSTPVAAQQSTLEALLTRRGFWTYQWQPSSAAPTIQPGEIQTLNVRYYPDGTYILSVQFAGPSGGAIGERANNKGLWTISPTMYAALITEGPEGPFSTPVPGLIARVRSITDSAMVLTPLQGRADMVLSFRAAN